MNIIKEVHKAHGTGLKGAGRIGSLITPPSQVTIKDTDLAQKVEIEYSEPGDFFVEVDGSQHRPATLKGGELYPYSTEEVKARKGSEYSTGRVVHVFRGHLKRGSHLRDGPGSFHYGSGEVFEGRWKNNVRTGLGALYLPSGYAYEGNFKDDKPHGNGVETFPFGEKYVGEFSEGRPHGKGLMYYTDNGSRYEGEWSFGEKHGKGIIYYNNGDIFQGHWVGGRREGTGYATCKDRKENTYISQWHRDYCVDKKFKFIEHGKLPDDIKTVIDAPSQSQELKDIITPLGIDLRTFRVVPNLWTEVHPAHFTRIKQAFEALDSNVCGELKMSHLEEIWDPTNIDTLNLYNTAAVDGAGSTIELIHVLAGLYPHLPNSETRRWVLSDISIEYLWRLRGSLADITSPRLDGFYTLTGGKNILLRKHLNKSKGVVGGVRVSRSMFVRNHILYGDDKQGTGANSVTSITHSGVNKEMITFPQLLEQIFPNLWKEFLLRCELTVVPEHALIGYSEGFDVLDENRTGYLSLEAMKASQKRLQYSLANKEHIISNPSNAYEKHIQSGIFAHQARWLIGDISLTIALIKQIDSRQKSGFVSLAEILRYSFPNVPCNYTKERLAVNVKLDVICSCCICAFCAGEPKFLMMRPPTPYSDGNVFW